MRRILMSTLIITVLGVSVLSGTGAFFTDLELSSGNTFAAGDIDLLVDNESYYNGEVSTSTSWAAQDLDNGLLFLNFTDLKPDDEGEDTISLHVNTNPAWLCLDMTLTSDDDISSNEPELDAGDVLEDLNDTWDGELGQYVEMVWWADDGDNVYEVGEELLTNGSTTIDDMFGDDNTFSATLADSAHNVWTGNPDDPAAGGVTHYVGKGWCFGNITLDPVADPQTDHDPLVDPGFDCDGTSIGNLLQTDGLTMDISFRAIQSQNNPDYLCDEGDPNLATITVIKEIVNDDGGNETVNDFQLFVVGNVVTPVTTGIPTQVVAGDYTVTEAGVSGYQASFSGNCNAAGQITLNPGDDLTCTITNDDIAPSITLIKDVINDNGGTALPVQFTLRIDGNVVPHNTSVEVTANTPHTIDEDAFAGYTFDSITGDAECPGALGGSATLDEGEAITCTIINDDIPN